MESQLKVEHWNVDLDGPFSIESMQKKLVSQGYDVQQYTFSPGTTFPDHTHPYTKKDAIGSGHFKFVMYGKEVVLGPGDMIVVPAKTVHNAAVVGNEDVIFFDSTK